MERQVIGRPDKPQVITTAHLKSVINEVSFLVRAGHEIEDVTFKLPKDGSVVVTLIYSVPKNLVLDYKAKGK